MSDSNNSVSNEQNLDFEINKQQRLKRINEHINQNINNKNNPEHPELSLLDPQTITDLQNLNQSTKSSTRSRSILQTAKDIFNIQDPYERWEAFITSQEDQLQILDTDLSTIKMINLPDPSIIKDIYHELSDKYNGATSAKYLITEFGSQSIYKLLLQYNIKNLTDITTDITQSFYLKYCDIKPPFLNLQNIKTITKSATWTHVTKAQLGKIKDIAKRLNVSHGDYVFMSHLSAFNAIYNNNSQSNTLNKSSYNLGYRKYISPKGYMDELIKALYRFQQELINYIQDIYPHLKDELRIQEINAKDVQNNNMYINLNIPNSIQIQFPTLENIKRMKKIIKECEEFIKDPKQKTIDEF